MEKHLYIDYSNLLFKIIYAIKSNYSNMGYGIIRHALIKHIISIVERFPADKVYIMCDSSKNWRKLYYAPYKGHRKESREKEDIDWAQAFQMGNDVKRGLKENFPFYVLECNYLEADDIIGYFCKTHAHIDKLVISPDRDFVQLHRYGNLKVYDLLHDKYLTTENAYVSLQQKIIMGDKSDNVPSIQKGLGEVKSLKLIESGDLEKQLAELAPDGSETDFSKNYKRNTKLIDLSKTPSELIERLKVYIDEYKLSSSKGMYDLFAEFGLLDLMEKVDKINSKIRHLNPSQNQQIQAIDAMVEVHQSKNKFESMYQD